jgi:hypothetical protein
MPARAVIEQGVDATVRLVTDAALGGTTGRFFDRSRETRANPQAYDEGTRTELWRRSLQLTDRADAA